MKSMAFKLCSAIASLALFMATFNINLACAFVAHQPKMPVQALKLRKF